MTQNYTNKKETQRKTENGDFFFLIVRQMANHGNNDNEHEKTTITNEEERVGAVNPRDERNTYISNTIRTILYEDIMFKNASNITYIVCIICTHYFNKNTIIYNKL